MRILHILDHSLPLHSGYAFRTIAILREQRALGWETFHLTTPRQGPTPCLEEEIDGWHFYRTPKSETVSLPGWNEIREMAINTERIAAVVEEVKPDILHPHSPVLNALPAIRVGRRLGIPVVYEMRASWEDAAVDHGSTREGSLRYRLSRALETYALRRADQITTICEGLRQDIVGRGIPSDKVVVIPNAVDVESFSAGRPPDEVLRSELGLEGATVLGFIGSFYAYEGLDLLIEALKAILPRHPAARILLVGGGSHEPRLRQLATELGVLDKIVFAGRVPNAQVQRYYDLIDVLAYPRRSIRLTELVTPLKPLEAMAQGRIFVASNVGGHRELIRDGETGYLFPPDDPAALAQTLETVLGNRAEWERVRKAGRHFVETERTWAHSVARYSEVYARALACRRA
ncbi:MAG: glycosyltransferase, exosortase A system-associated [Rhodocyclaceae bacterium]|nr:glycosyltransferase, exosortase A system-associated [Rhodocyclaceae bacterium]